MRGSFGERTSSAASNFRLGRASLVWAGVLLRRKLMRYYKDQAGLRNDVVDFLWIQRSVVTRVSRGKKVWL